MKQKHDVKEVIHAKDPTLNMENKNAERLNSLQKKEKGISTNLSQTFVSHQRFHSEGWSWK